MKDMFVLSEKGFRKLFYTLLMFGKHRKFGQTKINFCVVRKITRIRNGNAGSGSEFFGPKGGAR